ncbi:MAG: pilus assembly protein PilP [Deltaproteobacteria bacterium]|nr:pilus assembly protein PilP [Deltaproteobacteria bacterium]
MPAGAPVPVARPAPAPPPAQPAFTYSPVGLRDPFEPFIKLEEKKVAKRPVEKVAAPQTPLQRYSTEELKLAGIVWGEEGRARALIEDPQGKGYAVAVGTLVGDRGGRVVRILPDRIIIEERFKDILGEEKKAVANMMLHKSDGAVSK